MTIYMVETWLTRRENADYLYTMFAGLVWLGCLPETFLNKQFMMSGQDFDLMRMTLCD